MRTLVFVLAYRYLKKYISVEEPEYMDLEKLADELHVFILELSLTYEDTIFDLEMILRDVFYKQSRRGIGFPATTQQEWETMKRACTDDIRRMPLYLNEEDDILRSIAVLRLKVGI